MRSVILLFLFAFILVSCNKHLTNLKKPENLVIFPPPPDTTKIQFLTSFSGSIDITGGRSSFKKFVLGEEKEELISKPYGIEIKNSKIYISDTGIDGIEIIDLEKNSFDFFIPSGYGQLKQPINSFIDNEENLYVADADRGQIVVFDKKRKYLNAFGKEGVYKPTDVFVYEDKIFVANIKDHKIDVFDKSNEFRFLYSFPDLGAEDEGFLNQPLNLYVNKDKVYVTDAGSFKVKSYTHDGNYIAAVGGLGKGFGYFTRPKGIAVDKDEILHVVDAAFANVQMFNDKGQLLMFYGGAYTGKGYMYLPANITIDYDHLSYFQEFVDPNLSLKYLIFVTNQYGPDKITVYGAVE